MKYKVGDKVRIREDLVVDEFQGKYMFINNMNKYKGKEATITKVYSKFYDLDIGKNYCWTDEMLEEPVKQNESNSTKSIIKIRQVDNTTYATYNTHDTGKSVRNANKDKNDNKIGILIAVARALGIEKEKVNKIINVLFDEYKEDKTFINNFINKNETDFKVGDRVIGIGVVSNRCINNITGTIKIIDSDDIYNIGIEFDENINSSTRLYNEAKNGHGLWVCKHQIKYLSKEEEENILLQKNYNKAKEELNELKDMLKKLKALLI